MSRRLMDMSRQFTAHDGGLQAEDGDVASGATMDNEVGSTLRRLRGPRTQLSLANLAGVGQKTISEIETGKRIPSPIVVSKLEAALDGKGQLDRAVQRAGDDRAGWAAVLAHLEAVQTRLDALEANTTLLIGQLAAGDPIAGQLRQWVVELAGYGADLTEGERSAVTTLVRQPADKHVLSISSH
jgi:transcriptional regulator with XRE-family HTH domain